MKMVDGDKLHIVIVDDDAEMRRKLQTLIGSIEPVTVDAEAATAPQAARKIEELRPDVVVLDIDLPNASGIAQLRSAQPPCVIAVTAHPEQALPGFDLDAVDYIVKPVTRERLAKALHRVRRRIAERRIAELALEIASASAVIRGAEAEAAASSNGRYSDQMTIRVRRRMFALPISDISWIEGASQYSRVHAKGGEYLLSRSLASLECELDPKRFFRIHRSAIVNAAYVREVMSRGDGRYIVYLRGGEALPLGRARRDTLNRLLGGIGGRANGGLNAAGGV